MTKQQTLPLQKENIPETLKAYNRWVLWGLKKPENPNAKKWTKVPLQINGQPARTNDRRTFTSFATAVETLETDTSGKFSGIGIVLPDKMVGVDLDDCIHNGEFSERANLLFAMFPTYTELSPGGKGIKLIAFGALNHDYKSIDHNRGVEMYDGGTTNRFFTLTGNVVGGKDKITGQPASLFDLQVILSDPLGKYEEIRTEDHTERAKILMPFIDTDLADPYSSWLQVGMALSHCDPGDEMLQLWKDFSKHSTKYYEKEHDDRWKTFRRKEGQMVTIKYLERLAKENGFRERAFTANFITADKLATQELKREYVIEDFMVINEPMVIGGPSKCLKTSVALDMAVSIATGTKFLNHFPVPKRHRIAFISGESGEKTIQENLIEIATSKKVPLADLRLLYHGFKLPKLDDLGQVDDLIEQLLEFEVRITIIDPLYRSLRVGDSASNVYAMGEKLELIAEKIHRAGITPILCHHFRKAGNSFSEIPELEDLSQSGVAEFGRQFLLLKRREPYSYDGNHRLWFVYGGSAGHQGRNVLDVYTATRTSGLTWATTLKSLEDAIEEEKLKKEAIAEKKEATAKEDLIALIRGNPGLTTSEIGRRIKKRKAYVLEAIAELESSDSIRFEEGPRNSKLWFVH